jgi:hypothetical protein
MGPFGGSIRIAQDRDGSISGCFTVGALPLDMHTIEIHDFVPIGEANDQGPLRTTITVTPAAGLPGTVARIEGYLPEAAGSGGDPADPSQDRIQVCWVSCRGGGRQASEELVWQPDGRFSTTLHVPAAPWLAPDGPRPVAPGTYPVELGCIQTRAREPDCGGGPQARASFTVTEGPAEGCPLCTRIRLSPPSAPAGAAVRITGWAPLTPFYWQRIGSGYDLKVRRGAPEGPPMRIEPLRDRTVSISLAPTAFTVIPGLHWADLGKRTASLVQPGEGLASDPSDPSVLALCVPDAVRVSRDAGATWSETPSLAAVEAADRTGFPIALPQWRHATCTSAVADHEHPDSIFAVFDSTEHRDGPRNEWFSGYFTTDSGRTWNPVPVPSGASPNGFGWFRRVGDVVQGAFLADPRVAGERLVIQETRDGGRTWSRGRLRCPSRGPCMTWAPQSVGDCGQFGWLQSVHSSADGGRTWSSLRSPEPFHICGDAGFLAGIGSDEALVLTGDASYTFPLALLDEDGRSWQPVEIPPVLDVRPGQWDRTWANLTMISGGRVLAFGPEPKLLLPGARAWCRVTAPTTLVESRGFWPAPPYQLIGDRVWWTEPRREGSTTAVSLLADSIKC